MSREEWSAELRARQDQMRARSAPGSVRTTVAGRGRRKPHGPRAAEATDKALSAQQEPWRQRSDWVQHGSDRGDALTADAPARTVTEWRAHLRRLRISPSLIREIGRLEGWPADNDGAGTDQE